jgi:hypothetical protein
MSEYELYVTRETLQEMGLDDYLIDYLIVTVLLSMSLLLDMILMPMEPSAGSFTGAPLL